MKERQSFKTGKGEVLIEFVDGHWVIYPLKPTFFRKDPQAVHWINRQREQGTPYINEEFLDFEDFHLVDLSLSVPKGAYDRDTYESDAYIAPSIPNRSEESQDEETELSEDEYQDDENEEWDEDEEWNEDEEWDDEDSFDDGDSKRPLGGAATNLTPRSYSISDNKANHKKYIDGSVIESRSKNWKPVPRDESWFVPNAQIRLRAVLNTHEYFTKNLKHLIDALYRWSDFGNSLVFDGEDLSREIEEFMVSIFLGLGDEKGAESIQHLLKSPRNIRILLPIDSEWTLFSTLWHDRELDYNEYVPGFIVEWSHTEHFRLVRRELTFLARSWSHRSDPVTEEHLVSEKEIASGIEGGKRLAELIWDAITTQASDLFDEENRSDSYLKKASEKVSDYFIGAFPWLKSDGFQDEILRLNDHGRTEGEST